MSQTLAQEKELQALTNKLEEGGSSYLSKIDAIKAMVVLVNAAINPSATITGLVVEALVKAMMGSDRMVGREAVKALSEIGGSDSAKALIGELNREGTHLQQNIAEALGDMGAIEALAPLQSIADSGGVFARSAAKNAIQKINTIVEKTGGLPAATQTKPVTSEKPVATPSPVEPVRQSSASSQSFSTEYQPIQQQYATTQDQSVEAVLFEDMAEVLISEINCEVVRQSDSRIEVKCNIGSGRQQTVFLIKRPFSKEETTEAGMPEYLLSLYSVCAKLEDVNVEWALRYNMRLPYGALAVNEHSDSRGGKQAMLVMVASVPMVQIGRNLLSHMVRAVAVNSDRLEQNLRNGKDDF